MKVFRDYDDDDDDDDGYEKGQIARAKFTPPKAGNLVDLDLHSFSVLHCHHLLSASRLVVSC